MTPTCLECEEHFDIDDDSTVDDIVRCPFCKTRFEVLDLDPVMLDYADEKRELRNDEPEEEYIY